MIISYSIDKSYFCIDSIENASGSNKLAAASLTQLVDFGLRYSYRLSSKTHVEELKGINDRVILMKLSLDSLTIQNQFVLDNIVRNFYILEWASGLPPLLRVLNIELMHQLWSDIGSGNCVDLDSVKKVMKFS